MKLTLAQLAEQCGGRVEGDEDALFIGVKSLHQADPQSLSLFIDKRYTNSIKHTQAGAVLTTETLASSYSGNKLIVNNPLLAMAQILNAFSPPAKTNLTISNIAQSAQISASAIIGKGVTIAANAVIADEVVLGDAVEIGAGAVILNKAVVQSNTRIDANVTVYQNCQLGHRCHISSGVVIGADGFGFAETEHDKQLQWVAIPQVSRVLIGDDVHIGANTTIDRGSLEDTIISDGVIIDNLVQIGHNVTIGTHTAIVACSAVGGSAKIGKNCKIGGCATIAGHISICDNSIIFAESLITKSITEAGVYSSAMPAMPIKKWRKTLARFRLTSRT